MGGSSSDAPSFPTVTNTTGGLFGTTTTGAGGSSFDPTEFQKNLVSTSETGALNALNEYLNPNYDSDEFKQADSYYTNKMNTNLQNNYLNPALSKNLLRGSTASDIMRGFAQDMADTEYERQRDYKDQQLEKLQTALLGYNNIYDIYKGNTGLSQSLANSIASYNLAKYNAENSNSNGSGIGSLVGGLGSLASGAGTLISAL